MISWIALRCCAPKSKIKAICDGERELTGREALKLGKLGLVNKIIG